ncbi:hypothetical protein B0J18DRAFT_427196 [Chaetomium sp. MPI-SDFR-AT-0129]|nr:hypothetical protein B0J18DRAFT_427196 [Chaetomium sp. MPI-SDFR-AT-0129]
MSPRFACPLCGVGICGPNTEIWLSEYRGVYTTPEKYIQLTGVGRNAEIQIYQYIAPPNPSARWDDPGYGNPEADEFGVMTQGPRNGRHGYVFHDACWYLLEKAFAPGDVPLSRVMDVCASIPMEMVGHRMYWGHDYGGMTVLRKENTFPWETPIVDLGDDEDLWAENGYFVDPRATAEVDEIVRGKTQEPPAAPPSLVPAVTLSQRNGNDSNNSGDDNDDSTDLNHKESTGHTDGDPFMTLPQELCSAIASYLPTRDALNVRLASRSFWHIYYSQQFWASRFAEAGERSWFYEVRERHGQRPWEADWRWIYRRTGYTRLSPGLRNRARIWELILGLVPVLNLGWADLPDPLPQSWQVPPKPAEKGDADLPWLSVGGNMKGDPEDFSPLEIGGRLLRSERVGIPERVASVDVSTTRLANSGYIAGLSLTLVSGAVIRVGRGDFAQGSVRLREGLMGFHVAVGLNGIHGLRCVDGGQEEEVSAWLGFAEDVPQTTRLTLGWPVAALEIGFDGFKIVSIAVAPGPTTSSPDPSPKADIRHAGVWYPTLPPPTVSLHDTFFPAALTSTRGLHPLFWTSFGGPGGIYLRHLNKITICWYGLSRIEFSFDPAADVPDESRVFGRIEDRRWTKKIELEIDGSGGEVVDRIEVAQHVVKTDPTWRKESGGTLAWLKVSCLSISGTHEESRTI